MSTLAGKVAIVTGSSQGIGAGIALRLAADGAQVVVNYSRSAPQAAAVVQKITAAGGQAIAIKADISQPAQIQPLIDGALAAFGRLDILVNNAGVYKVDSLQTLSAESFDQHFHLNVRGLLLTTQAAARVLPAGGGSSTSAQAWRTVLTRWCMCIAPPRALSIRSRVRWAWNWGRAGFVWSALPPGSWRPKAMPTRPAT
jgi:NAD(P)-dependent dehydrogenase (short-subunit alcohol dehydrogenase family)